MLATGRAKTKIIVSAPSETKERLESLLKAVGTCVTPTVSGALNQSMVCELAIREFLAQYERAPEQLATKLGFSTTPAP